MTKRLLAVLLCLALAATANWLPAKAAEPQSLTLLVYVVGSDLESQGGYATQDITEMLRAQPNPDRLTVLVMTGGADSWANNQISPKELSIFKISGRNPELLYKDAARSMGDPETLSFFLRFGVENHPAEAYGLVLWDHGGGPMLGFGVDEQHGNDKLSMLELQQALQASPFDRNKRLDWLAFDACLMATVEVASMMAPHARYMIASEEVLPGPGFDYGFLKTLNTGSLSPERVARVIIDHTHAYYEGRKERNPNYDMAVTLSLVDLDKVAPLEQAVDRLFGDLLQGLEVDIYSDVARSRDASKVYGITGTTNTYDLIDLHDLAEKMAEQYPQEAAEVQRAILDAVVYNRTNIGRSWGLALYFPFTNKGPFERVWGDLYEAFGILPAYQGFMRRFGSILLSDSLAQWQGSDAPAVMFDELTGVYHIQLSPEQIANFDRAEYYILAHEKGEEYRLVFASGDVTLDEDGRLTANFDGNVLYIGDEETGMMPTPFLRETEMVDHLSNYQIPVVMERITQHGERQSATGQLLAELNRQTAQAQITGAIQDDTLGTQMGKRDVDLEDWKELYLIYISYYLTRGQTGDPMVLGDWAASDRMSFVNLRADKGLKVQYSPLDRSQQDYYVMISAVDTQGYAYPSELMPLPPADTAQQEVPLPERPPVNRVAFSQQAPEPVLLSQGESLRATLIGVDFSAHGEENRLAPDTLHVQLLLENLSDRELLVTADWLSVNGIMLPVSFAHSIPPKRSAMEPLLIPIAPTGQYAALVDHGITRVEDIRFRLAHHASDGALMQQQDLTDEIQIATSIPVGAGFEPLQQEAFEPVLLMDLEGVRVEQVGPPVLGEDALELPLKVTNNSAHYDLLAVVESAVNGIMAQLSLTQEDVMPGTVLYTTASIPVAGTELSPDLEEYRYLFDTFDFLEKLGIHTPRDITLRLWMDTKSRLGETGRLSMAQKGGYVTIPVPGGEGHQQPLDDQGTLVLEQGGLKIVRLDSDPTGKMLYLHNRSQNTLTVYAFGKVWVDNEPYGLNYPLAQVLAPGASAYHQMFSLVPGVEPQGEQLSFMLNVLDTDENRLLFRTDKITMDLR